MPRPSQNRGERSISSSTGNGNGSRRKARTAAATKRSSNGFPVIVMGASAGGVGALTQVVKGLPDKLEAAVLVVMHMSPESPGYPAEILGRQTHLPADAATNGELIQPGRIYVSPPDQHLLVSDRRILLTRGPRENNARPAVDPLFRTAAEEFGSAVIGVILSGALDDGTLGLMEIKRYGGIAVVQDPEDAPFPSMPASSLQHVDVDYVRPAEQIGPLLAHLASPSAQQSQHAALMTRSKSKSSAASGSSSSARPRDIAELGTDALKSMQMRKPPSAFRCPDCGGALWELEQNGMLRYRCHVGHGYTGEALLAAHCHGMEHALWTALRALEESAAMHRRMSRTAVNIQSRKLARNFEREAEVAESKAGVIRSILTGAEPAGPRKARDIEQKAEAARDLSLRPARTQKRKLARRRNGTNGSTAKNGRNQAAAA